MVPPAPGSPGGPSNSPTSEAGPSLSGAEHPSPRPGSVPPSRLQVIKQNLLTKGFSARSADTIAKAQRASTQATYDDKWRKFSCWCDNKQIDTLSITTQQLADFFLHLFSVEKLAVSTIMVYRSAIATTIKAIGGPDFGQDKSLSAMIRNFHLQRPPKPLRVPQWSLSLVLAALRNPPFEPLGDIPLEFLTLKTVFLLALASGRRRSEIHALVTGPGNIHWFEHQVILRTHPDFIAKNQVLGSVARPITVKALSNFVGNDRRERLLCPVRALKWYLERSKPSRANSSRLFVHWKPSRSECTPMDISKWIVRTVKLAYEKSSTDDQSLKLARVTAHEVRALAASWALFNGAPAADVLQAGTWRSKNSFISFYLRDMAQESVSLNSMGPISSGQLIVAPPRLETPSSRDLSHSGFTH